MNRELLQGREVIIEIFSRGAVCEGFGDGYAKPLTEVSIQGPANASESTLKRNAMKRLEYVLKKNGVIAE